MHGVRGGDGEERGRLRRHMLPVPFRPPALPVAPSGPDSAPAASDSFLKDGRQIRVGDCALFQAGSAPPFIGIIRRFVTSKEDYLKLCVNWLYRPADAKLARGLSLDAAPNEVFYSFHKDVIAAASLLHPCKVAFLRKGVDLPSGISSFVCRRVYDIESKCLWWLTDQDYINERQEEVDQLLDKSRLEMHAAVQSGGRSPKRLNGQASTQQLKSGSDNGSSFSSQVKGKKRDRGDQVTESVKRERYTKAEDGESVNLRLDGLMKAEISKITDKGGLTSLEGVDKLVHLMQLDRAERKIDLAGRILLADVITATDRNECLSKFVQLRGVSVLDYWLQEAHKGKSGDGSSPKESDKAAEELLFALLRALDKLPVSLHALQTCTIGKSVNHLRSHKNVEIQKKARGLVDTWKKRVDAEIKINDANALASSQTVHWQGKPGLAEVPHPLNKNAGSGDVTVKSPIIQPSTCRVLPSKPGPGDAIVKSTPVTMGSLKLPSSFPASGTISSKDSLSPAVCSTGNLDLPQSAAKEEKSSSSSQSFNNSQSCSSDHLKTMSSSWKEDARSSTAGSVSAGKTSSGSSRHRRSSNGFPGSNISGVQKETNLGKSGSLIRAATLDKVPHGALTCERPFDVPVSDPGNSHRLIVRLPNPGRSPAPSVAGGSIEETSVIGSRVSSPSTTDKHENSDRKIKVRADRSHIPAHMNAESRQSSGGKEVLAACDESERLPAVTLDDERKCSDKKENSTDVSKATCTLGNEKAGCHNESKPRNSFSSINALIESCVKHSEASGAPASSALSSADDIGMNLLASVAAGEMSKSYLKSATVSPGSLPAIKEPSTANNESMARLSCDVGVVQSHGQTNEDANADYERPGKSAGSVLSENESQEMGTDFLGEKKITVPLQEHKLIGEHTGQPVPNTSLRIKSEIKKLEDERSDKGISVCAPADVKKEIESDSASHHQDKLKNSMEENDNPRVRSSLMDEKQSADCSEKITDGETLPQESSRTSNSNGRRNRSTASGIIPEKPVVSESMSSLPFGSEVPIGVVSAEKQPYPVVEKHHAVYVDKRGDDAGAGAPSVTDEILCVESVDAKIADFNGSQVSHPEPSNSERKEQLSNCAPSSIDEPTGSIRAPLAATDGVEEIVDRKEATENHSAGSTKGATSPTHPTQDRGTKSTVSRLSGADADRGDATASSAGASAAAVTANPDTPAKIDFDLNEGITGDDGNPSEPATLPAVSCAPAVHLPCLASFSSSPMSNGSPATITVAAPAKGSFIPPENLCKAEPGWKGSAATSAFRPAEPRKVLELPLTTIGISPSVTAVKRHRPLFDIDLNVPDERGLEDMASQGSAQTTGSESGVVSNRDLPVRSSGGLDLDLNLVGEGAENGQFLGSTSCRLDRSVLPVRPASRGLSIGDTNMSRDFDLNNGPGFDELAVESLPRSQYAKINTTVPMLPSIAGLRMNNPEFGSVSSWFPPSNSYPAVAIPSFLPDRGEFPYHIATHSGPQRIMGSVSGGGSFGGEIYRGPVLSSSPAMAFSPATYPYTGYQYASSYPVVATTFSGVSTSYVDSSPGGGSCYPAIPPQFVGPAGALSSHYPRPYVLSLPEGGGSGGSDSSRRWTRQGLDLNAGPGSTDLDVKDDRMPSVSRQHPVASPQAFLEEQARLYQVAGGAVKRKEPEGGWDSDRYSGYKQHSWQ